LPASDDALTTGRFTMAAGVVSAPLPDSWFGRPTVGRWCRRGSRIRRRTDGAGFVCSFCGPSGFDEDWRRGPGQPPSRNWPNSTVSTTSDRPSRQRPAAAQSRITTPSRSAQSHSHTSPQTSSGWQRRADRITDARREQVCPPQQRRKAPLRVEGRDIVRHAVQVPADDDEGRRRAVLTVSAEVKILSAENHVRETKRAGCEKRGIRSHGLVGNPALAEPFALLVAEAVGAHKEFRCHLVRAGKCECSAVSRDAIKLASRSRPRSSPARPRAP
jgi:hypothetical protein